MMASLSTLKFLDGFTPNPRKKAKVSGFAQRRYPCATIWPNGEFGLSWHKKDEAIDPWQAEAAGGVSLEHMRLISLILEFEREYLKAVARAVLYPWLVKSTKLAQRPKTYGRKGLTAYGSKVVRNGAHLLQQKYGKDRLAFITFTLPPLSHGDAAMIAGRWGYLLKTVLQSLRRLLARQGLPESIVLVTELQPRRLESGDLGALHVHLVLVGRCARQTWAYSPFVYKSLWLRLLSNLLGKPLECYPVENVERVKHDAANYLSKYMSKGTSDIAEYADIEGWECVPRQWWSATVPIKKAVKRYTIKGEKTAQLLDEVLHNYWKKGGVPNSNGVVFSRPITIEGTKYQDIVIGYFGKITDETYQDLYDLSVSYRDSVLQC